MSSFRFLASTSALLAAAALAPTPTRAQLPAGATVYASHLDGPRGLAFGPDGTLYIAEAGTGGTVAAPAGCPNTPPPVGPYHGGYTARISRVLHNGHQDVLTKGLPSSIAGTGDVQGIADVTFLNGQLYALLAGGGCAHGNPGSPNGILSVDTSTRKTTLIADFSAFLRAHPAAYPNADDYEPDGVPYSFTVLNDILYSVEPNHGEVLATATDGTTTLLRDISLAEGHIVPTSIVAGRNGNLYLGNLGLFPILMQREIILTLSKDSFFIDTIPGFVTPSSEVGMFHLVHSRAGFTTILSLKFGPDGLLYVLELSDAPGYPTPGAGKVVRVNAAGNIETVVTGLAVPTGMTFGPDNALYVSNFGAAPAGLGQVLRIPITF